MKNVVTRVEGVIEGLERTTHVSGREHTSTTHITLFKLGGQRVALSTAAPAVISDGDQVAVAGLQESGQFTAYACRNRTTGWVSPLKQQGCAFAALVGTSVICFLLFFLILPIFMGGVCIWLAIKIKKRDRLLREAYLQVANA